MSGKRWWILTIIVIVLLAALFVWLATQPGVLLVHFAGWRIETTVLVAAAIVIAAWIVLSVAWWLLRWPFGALVSRQRRISHERLRYGLVALIEGHNVEAARVLQRAAQYGNLRALALLTTAEAAHRHGDTARALEALNGAAQHAPEPARLLRARILREDGRAGKALRLLAPSADAGRLPPAGWHEYALAALAAGQPEHARAALEPLRRSDMLREGEYSALVIRVLGDSLGRAPDAEALADLWKRLTRQQRQMPELIEVYARRAEQLGMASAALDQIEAVLKRDWHPQLVDVYGDIAHSPEAVARLRNATRWLDAHPDDDVLLRTLGALSMRTGDSKRAGQYLVRALAAKPSAASWAALGDVQAAAGEADAAVRCYANAWKCGHGELIGPGPHEAGIDCARLAFGERDEHAMPRRQDGEPQSAG